MANSDGRPRPHHQPRLLERHRCVARAAGHRLGLRPRPQGRRELRYRQHRHLRAWNYNDSPNAGAAVDRTAHLLLPRGIPQWRSRSASRCAHDRRKRARRGVSAAIRHRPRAIAVLGAITGSACARFTTQTLRVCTARFDLWARSPALPVGVNERGSRGARDEPALIDITAGRDVRVNRGDRAPVSRAMKARRSRASACRTRDAESARRQGRAGRYPRRSAVVGPRYRQMLMWRDCRQRTHAGFAPDYPGLAHAVGPGRGRSWCIPAKFHEEFRQRWRELGERKA